MKRESSGGERQKGTRGHEIDATITFAHPLTREEAVRVTGAWGLTITPYGEQEVRALRLTGNLDRAEVARQLQVGLEGGVYRSVEIGLRPYLRSAEGHTEYLPWKRNRVLPRSAWNDVDLEEGVRYVLE